MTGSTLWTRASAPLRYRFLAAIAARRNRRWGPARLNGARRAQLRTMPAAPSGGLPLWLALPLAAAAGPILAGAFPARGWWPLAFVGTGLILVTLIGRRAGSALLVGFVAGLSFYLVLVHWTSLYLGPLPWSALSIMEGFFFGLGAMLIALAYRWAPAAWPTPLGRLGLVPVVIAGLWTAREAFVSVWPYGGFAWGRLAESQSLSPLAPLVAWLGVSGLSFAIAWATAVIIECIRLVRVTTSTRGLVAIGSLAVLFAIPAWPTPTSGSVRVAAVQGNGPAGYFQHREPGEVLNDQVSATLPILHKNVDMVIWPEGSTYLDPLRNSYAASALTYISGAMHAPLLVGTVTHRGGKYYGTSLLWTADKGAIGHYDKMHPVPFGEYIPDRWFWNMLAPDLIGLIQRDYSPGTGPNVLTIDGVRAGIAMCFDIVDDQLTTDMMSGGAQVIIAQTNNADFGRTEENVQQLAIARLRAIETGRSLVNISTVGTSEVIAPNGGIIDQLPPYRPGAMVTSVPLGTTTTPATLGSRGIEWMVCGLGLASLVAGAVAAAARRRSDA